MHSIGHLPVLVVHDDSETGLTVRNAVQEIMKELDALGVAVLEAQGHEDGELSIETHPELGAVLVGWAEGRNRPDPRAGTGSYNVSGPSRLLSIARQRFDGLPVFLMTEGLSVEDLPPEIAESLAGAVWITEDSPQWVAGHVKKALEHYRDRLFPPFFGELVRYVDEYKYAWHTPGHMGGLAFLKSPAGRLFFDFLGENALRADLSSSVPELGSILEHEGVVADAERRAAAAFGADETYFVTNGTTMSNQIVFRSVVTPGDVVLLDRNCHKSILNSVIQTGAVPVWMLPVRNRFGMIGPINPAEMSAESITAKLEAHSLLRDRAERSIRMAVITNSTYDGTMYNTERVIEMLGGIVPTIHFDEAWIPYAAFHPLYAGHFAMSHPRPGLDTDPTVISTMSTHKMLAALSQASMIHIRQGRAPLPAEHFNEAFMMHTSTSPQYLIFASLDVATKMMEGAPGRALMVDAISEAVAFRKELAKVRRHLSDRLEWWFDVCQPEHASAGGIGESVTGEAEGSNAGSAVKTGSTHTSSFAESEDHVLADTQALWCMEPGQAWHGFPGLVSGYSMLDPTKVSITTPGLEDDGRPSPSGIPASLVSGLLGERGVVSEKTGFYSLLFLFSIGVTKGKCGTLLAELFDFKRLFDENADLRDAMPNLVRQHPQRYAAWGLRNLADEMHDFLAERDTSVLQTAISEQLPEPAMTPSEAFAHLVRGEVEHVPLAELEGRVTAVLCVLYPPGIPVVVPGERFDSGSRAIVDYLKLFEAWDNRFPGFEAEVQGVVKQRDESGTVRFFVNCVTPS
jgi:lysine decarboxylase/arginine decarboxylase